MSEAAEGTWLVLGAGGFVGSAVVAELRSRGIAVRELPAPRLSLDATVAREVLDAARSYVPDDSLVSAFQDVSVVVNAAGLATPGAGGSPELTGANALLPAVVALLAASSGVRRMVHLSSASVQGHSQTIDESSRRAPFSAYSRSKALGEEVLDLLESTLDCTTVRATSVQGGQRPTTQSLAKIARSPLASVAAPGTAATPVSSIDALAWFVAEAALFAGPVPSVVLQPWEGMTVSSVLQAAGGRFPLMLPGWFCRFALDAGYRVSRLLGERLHGPLRRVELMWFGQQQTPGWAESVGLQPVPAVARVLAQARH